MGHISEARIGRCDQDAIKTSPTVSVSQKPLKPAKHNISMICDTLLVRGAEYEPNWTAKSATSRSVSTPRESPRYIPCICIISCHPWFWTRRSFY
ncbi:hypothetical protein PAXINDRAFT_171260 [Paxillus involutus ATCC 200175]|uniref:Uncharacterized protein n=1 Tax=Paxillus involutus ATCC 200175 TaxID=664439 RepID=A0A0C9STT6_PAXIN|nr:hypothetical protein PAXINDRAFT_171260 [Paxillus involutus ATCC 200175]